MTQHYTSEALEIVGARIVAVIPQLAEDAKKGNSRGPTASEIAASVMRPLAMVEQALALLSKSGRVHITKSGGVHPQGDTT